jgi:hypothetical protein
MGRLRAALALAAVLCAAPGVAAASTVTADPVTRQAVFTGGAGTNDVTMSSRGVGSPFESGPALWFIDAAQELNAGAGCVAGLPVWCQAFHARVDLDGGNDRFGPAFSDGDITVNGGTGEDHIDVNGNDNTASGGSGADWLRVGGNIIGYGYGNRGDDNIRSAASSWTVLSGGSGDDLVYGERHRNSLAGKTGDDYLILGGELSFGTGTGGSGDDVMLVVDSTRLGASTAFSGGDGGDLIVGQRGGTDAVSGDGGDDVIDVSGDARPPDFYLGPDTVDCGSGNDTVYADADDVVADDCENRAQGPMPANHRVHAALARLAGAFGVTVAG